MSLHVESETANALNARGGGLRSGGIGRTRALPGPLPLYDSKLRHPPWRGPSDYVYLLWQCARVRQHVCRLYVQVCE